MYWVISTKHLHKVAPKMNSLRRNSAKPSEKAGRIQHLVQIGFDTQITKRNLTEEGRAELYTIYQESFDKCYIPKDWKKHRERSPQDEWVLHPHNAKHCWEAHGMLCCQEICQRPQGQGDTLCKWGGGWGVGVWPGKCMWGKCSCIYIWCVQRIPEERTNRGCGNWSRGCSQQSPV